MVTCDNNHLYLGAPSIVSSESRFHAFVVVARLFLVFGLLCVSVRLFRLCWVVLCVLALARVFSCPTAVVIATPWVGVATTRFFICVAAVVRSTWYECSDNATLG